MGFRDLMISKLRPKHIQNSKETHYETLLTTDHEAVKRLYFFSDLRLTLESTSGLQELRG